MKGKIPALVRIAVGCVFIVSGFLKLVQPYQNFLDVIHRFELVGGRTAVVMAIALPWVEFTGGVFLALGLWFREAAAALWCLNTLFIAALASALLRRLPVENCGCFGEKLSLPVRWTLALDVGLWLLFWFLFKKKELASILSLDRQFSKEK